MPNVLHMVNGAMYHQVHRKSQDHDVPKTDFLARPPDEPVPKVGQT